MSWAFLQTMKQVRPPTISIPIPSSLLILHSICSTIRITNHQDSQHTDTQPNLPTNTARHTHGAAPVALRTGAAVERGHEHGYQPAACDLIAASVVERGEKGLVE